MSKKKANKKVPKKSSVKKTGSKKEQVAQKPSVARPGSIAEMVIKLQKERTKAGQDIIFNDVIEKIDPLIKRIVGKFNIPGYESSDLYQEALYAVRFKAISDFDVSRIIGDDFVVASSVRSRGMRRQRICSV
jgi:hypothetical protein